MNVDRIQYLYHATYSPLLPYIKSFGLGGYKKNKAWEDSKNNVVYLATDLDEAISYAETSELVPESWLEKIIVLKIPIKNLSQEKLTRDENVIDGSTTFEYHGIIPFQNIEKIIPYR
jgi:hypothetical protein